MTGVTESTANLRLKINPNGLSTTYRFEYVADAVYQVKGFADATIVPPGGKSLVGDGTTSVIPPAQVINALDPGTAYHYRPVATNSADTVIGPEHILTTEEVGETFRLPDNRGWEMVSPVDKGGDAIAAPGAIFGGGAIQAASGAPVVTYGSATAFGAAPGAPPASQYLSRRTASGWTTENISTPLDSAAYGDEPDGAPYRLFSADLTRAVLFGGLACRGGLEACPSPNQPLAGSGAPLGYMAYYLRDGGSGSFSSLLTEADVEHSAVSPAALEVSFVAASPDLAHLVLSSCAALTATATEVPDGPGHCDPAAPNLYRRSSSGLEALNMLPGDTVGTPGAEIAAPNGAISSDGSRIYWTLGGDLYLREGTQTHLVEALGGEGSFQVASADGAVAYFTKGAHLYRFEAPTQTVSDLTPAGGVVGVLGASVDGSHVYYQDATGLRLWHGGVTTPVAPGIDATLASNYPPATGTSRVSPDGAHLAFLSQAELTGYDNLDAETGQPRTELYLYGSPLAGGPPTLVCASCNPAGERPRGDATIPGALVNGSTHGYRPRVLSSNGNRVFFDSEDVLAADDTNGQPDVYEWEAKGVGDCNRSPGCVRLISSGRGADTRFLDASADGSDVFFLTGESLLPGIDPGSIDVYDARVGGGFPEAPKPIPCIADACQGLPAPPDDPTPGTLAPSSGNPPLQVVGPKPQKHKKKRHRKKRHKKHGKIAKAREGWKR